MTSKLKLLITRPEQQGLQLQQALKNVNIESYCCPLIDYKQNTSAQAILILNQAKPANIVVFVSVAAGEYANKALALSKWLDKKQKIIAVGETTQKALEQHGIRAISPPIHTSEGLLNLPELSPSQITNDCHIIIVRGNGGRELLATELIKRGAQVTYLESYTRNWLAIYTEQRDKWNQQNINGIVITSNALLNRVVDLIDISNNYWQNTCLWVVASERIMQSAKNLGLINVVNSNGADDQAITKTLLNMDFEHDRKTK